jgi:macrolide transport system ATP-binding/permease protein
MRMPRWIDALPVRLRSVFRRARAEQDLDEELSFHLEMQTHAGEARGLSRPEAERRARIALQGVQQTKERSRDMWPLRWADDVLQDVRYALRCLRRTPGFTAVAVITLALGIGFNSALFTIVDAALIRSLPVERPDRLVDLDSNSGGGTSSYADYLDFKARNDTLVDILAYSPMFAGLNVGERARFALGEVVTGNYFQLLGVRAAVGRTLLPDDDRPGAPRAVVIANRLWTREFGANPSAVNQTIHIHGQPYTIVGVAPASFTGMLPVLQPEIWTPMVWSEDVNQGGFQDIAPSPGRTRLERRGQRWLSLKGRLNDSQSVGAVQANLQLIMGQLADEYPTIIDRNRAIRVLRTGDVRLIPEVDRPLRLAASGLMFIVGLVLLIACANVASMLLARSTGRQHEFGVRLAIGASRGRLLRQLLVESLMLSALGAVAGLVLARGVLQMANSITPPIPVPLFFDFALNTRVLWFTAAIAMVTGLVAGLAPAVRASRPDLVGALKGEMAAIRVRRARWTMLDALVAFQMTVTLVLLVLATITTRSTITTQEVDLGFRRDGLATVMVMDYDATRARQFQEQALDRVRSVAGVESAALASRAPLTINFSEGGVEFPGRQRAGDPVSVSIQTANVSADYFATLGVRILEGRPFNSGDTPTSPRVAVVSEALARRYWPGESAIGKRFQSGGADVDIVGVSADYKVYRIGEEPTPYIHYASSQRGIPELVVLARARGDAKGLALTVQRELRAIDPNIVFPTGQTMEENADAVLLPARLAALSMSVAGVVASALAAVGLYGVIAYWVSRRTREIGVRMALGARPVAVMGLVMRQGLAAVVIGIILGSVLAIGAARLLTAVLYGVSPTDPLAWSVALAVLLGSGLVAVGVPARRAANLEPMTALRSE